MSSSPVSKISTTLGRAHYAAVQTARIAWYTGHYLAGRTFFGAIGAAGRVADRGHLGRRFREVFEAEQRSIETGEYRLPRSLTGPPPLGALLSSSTDYLRDARRIARRRKQGGHSEVLTEAARERFPRYFLQNFHFQSDGWLSAESASRYDMQVETLFTGAAEVMRRRALPAVKQAIALRDPQTLRLIDLGCGCGGFLEAIKENWPELHVTALDLSPAYLGEARTRLAASSRTAFRQAPAEATGYEDSAFDIVSSVYLFHELPPSARAAAAREIGRILKPGGVYVHADTIQYGDDPPLDALLEAFPRAVHEPYYDSYCRTDLDALFGDAGLTRADGGEHAFLTKISVFRKA